jgi:hypothetical protein
VTRLGQVFFVRQEEKQRVPKGNSSKDLTIGGRLGQF